MGTQSFDRSDDRESAIADLIGRDGRVLWRADLPWHQGRDPKDRHVIGFVPGPMGSEIFMASARNSLGTVHGDVYMRAPIADVCRSGAPSGDVTETDLWFKGVFDGAILTEEPQMGTSKYVGRHLTHASAVYLLRITPDFDDQQERLAIAFARKEPSWMWPRAKIAWSMPFLEAVDLAARSLDSAVSAPLCPSACPR